MAAKPLEDRIEMSLDDVIGVDWRGKGRGGGGSGGQGKGRGKKAKVKSVGRLAVKGGGLVKRKVKGVGKGKAVKGAGRGLVKKPLFAKKRRLMAEWESPLRARKGIGKGKRKGSKIRSKGAGKGTGKDSWKGKGSGKDDGMGKGSRKGGQKGGLRQGFSLWKGASSVKRKGKGKGKSKSKGEGKLRKGGGKGALDTWRKGKGKAKGGAGRSKGKGKGKGKGRGLSVYRVRRDGGVQKRGSLNGGRMPRNGGSLKGAKGMGRALAIAATSSAKGSSKGVGPPRQPKQREDFRGDVELVEDKLSAEDKKMMKKITIVAQLDKVPTPSPAMQGLSLASSRSTSAERSGSLSRRFSANFAR